MNWYNIKICKYQKKKFFIIFLNKLSRLYFKKFHFFSVERSSGFTYEIYFKIELMQLLFWNIIFFFIFFVT
jgi:hypothetical protein